MGLFDKKADRKHELSEIRVNLVRDIETLEKDDTVLTNKCDKRDGYLDYLHYRDFKIYRDITLSLKKALENKLIEVDSELKQLYGCK